MDWVWRIGFLIILYFIGQALADVKLVTPNYSSGRVDEKAALLNALLPSLIIAFGALPLVIKMFPSLFPGNQKTSSQKNTSKDSQRSISNIGHKTFPIENEGKMHENNNPVSAAQQRKEDEKLYELVAAELSKDQKNEGLWLKAMAATEGDENKTKARYVELRIQSLKDERELAKIADNLADLDIQEIDEPTDLGVNSQTEQGNATLNNKTSKSNSGVPQVIFFMLFLFIILPAGCLLLPPS